MGNAKYVGRVEALAFTLGIGSFRRAAYAHDGVDRRLAVLVVIATVVPASTASASSSDVPPPKTALIMGGTSIPTWNDADVEVIMNQFIAPTHRGQDDRALAVTTPRRGAPSPDCSAFFGSRSGPPSIFGPGGRRGLMSRGGNSRGSSTSPTISRSRPGWPIWRRPWPGGNDYLVIYGDSEG